MAQSKIVNKNENEAITFTNLNNISLFLLEGIIQELVKDFITFSGDEEISWNLLLNLQGDGSEIINIATGTTLAVQKFSCFTDSFVILNQATKTLTVTLPTTSTRIDIVQIKQQYTSQASINTNIIDPDTGVVTPQLNYTEKLLDCEVLTKQGVEGSGVAPSPDSGYIKIAEFVVTTSAIDEVFNVDSEFGEVNSDWTADTTSIGLLIPHNQHRMRSTLDHPDYSVGLSKMSLSAIRNMRDFSIPAISIPANSEIILHELTLASGKVLNLLNMGICISNNGATDTNVKIHCGTYSSPTFTSLVSTKERNYDTTSNLSSAGCYQIRVKNDTSSAVTITAHFIYKIT